MSVTFATSRLYSEAVSSAIELFGSLSPDDWTVPAPCTPGWTVRDLLSHMSGVADDIINGRVEGAASDPWTAAQVERYKSDKAEDLLARWQEQCPTVADLLEQIGENRPVFDCHAHEHDIRHALGRPGNQDSEIIRTAAEMMAGFMTKSASVSVDLGNTRFGPEDAAVHVALSHFELFRSRLGRRTVNQVRSYDWSGEEADIEPIVDQWFAFGPTEAPITE